MKAKNTFNPCDLVIYGALGDLSKRKLIISLYRLENANFLEPDTRIIGVGFDPAWFVDERSQKQTHRAQWQRSQHGGNPSRSARSLQNSMGNQNQNPNRHVRGQRCFHRPVAIL